MTSAVLIALPVPKAGQAAANYTVQVRGANNTTGDYLLGFYLAGDVAGSGTVTTADLQAIKSDLGVSSNASNYNFDADVNRDGIIAPADLAFASMNVGASTKISPVISVNLNPAADPLNNRITSDPIVNFTGTVTPGADRDFQGDHQQLARRYDHGGLLRQLQHHGAPRCRSEHVQCHQPRCVRPDDIRPDRAGDLHSNPPTVVNTPPSSTTSTS